MKGFKNLPSFRQMYMVEDRRWVTLRESHLRCSHGEGKLGFKASETILAVNPSQQVSNNSREVTVAEPYEVVKILGKVNRC
jgi:DNA (cytosine-5)-methyltransferase 1